MNDDVGLRTFEAAMRIADLWIIRRSPSDVYDDATVYLVTPEERQPHLLTFQALVYDAVQASGWQQAAACLQAFAEYVPDYEERNHRFIEGYKESRPRASDA